ncbi:DUF748 domain-containing protein [Niveibacterium sp. SC-1]|uniref:DUF748 domain-containing protein n=1 Tax=Niveibacterium sp. SC-1 TaxID=3135646 RepID=UPI00311DCF2D
MSRRRRIFYLMLALLFVLVAGSLIGMHYAARVIRDRILVELGPEAQIGALNLHRGSVEILDLRIRAPRGWPAPETLRARRIEVEPDLRALLSGEIRVGQVLAEDAYLSLLRTRDGRLRLIPSLLERPGAPTPAKAAQSAAGVEAGRSTIIESVRFTGASVDFFDASVRRRPHQIRLENLEANFGPLMLPTLSSRTALSLAGTVKGRQRDGKLALKGWMEVASRDSELQLHLAGVDLSSFEPYLLRTSEAGVARGKLDLDMRSQVLHRRLKAPGKLTLTNMELGGPSFMGMPRMAVVNALKGHNGQLTVEFTLEGSLDDPKFSLNESFAIKATAAVAEALGLSLGGLVKGLGSGAEGLGETLDKLFGR